MSPPPVAFADRSGSPSGSRELRELLSSLPRDLILRVHNKYSLDYNMFGYDINTALRMGGHRTL